MNVILHAADDQRLVILIGQDAAEVTVQFLAERFVMKKEATILSRENRMNQNLGE